MNEKDVAVLLYNIIGDLQQQKIVDNIFKIVMSLFFYWVSSKISKIENKINDIEINK